MPSVKDERYKIIGGEHRALSRYYMMLNRCKNTHRKKNEKYSNVEVLVSKEEFLRWFMPRDFEGCSVDRIDCEGHYSLDNMQLLSMADNIRKDKIKAVDGFCECFSCKETKSLDLFAKDKRRFNGRSTLCKVCDNQRKRR